MINMLSIAICTYNRCGQLANTLSSLCSVKNSLMDGDEILVVDNNSTDRTQEVVSKFSKELPIQYVFEVEQGLAAARNRALSEFNNDVLIFFDDDVTVNSGCIEGYRKGVIEHPNHIYFGGPLSLNWYGKPIYWYRGNDLPLINGLLGYYNLGSDDIEYEPTSLLPYGANFAVRRSLMDLIGVFDVSFGVKGSAIGRGEETDYFRRAINAGAKGVYLSAAAATHHFQTERISIPYLYHYGIEKGKLVSESGHPDKWVRRVTCLTQALRGIMQLAKGRRDRFYQCIINIGIQRGIEVAAEFEQIGRNSRARGGKEKVR